MQCYIFCLAPFTQRSVIYVVACVSVLHCFFAELYGKNTLLSLHSWEFVLLHFSIMNNPGRKFVYKLMYKLFFNFSFGAGAVSVERHRSGIARTYGDSMFKLLKTSRWFSNAAELFSIPTAM